MSEAPTVPLAEAIHRAVTDLLDRLKAGASADFGSVARRPSPPGDWLVEALWDHRAKILEGDPAIAEWLRVAPAALVQGWIDWAYERNQFFELDQRQLTRLRSYHERWLLGVAAALRNSEHFEQFSRVCYLSYVGLAERIARALRGLTVHDGLRGRGAEYSPELQLKLLGLTQYQWREPIVDLGSGVEAHLVHHLRERGLAATGIERRGGTPYVLAKDWFEVRFEPGTIGTIISHLAFSLQFLHHHWQGSARAYNYAQKYMELLHSLIPGGTFAYAPGLPFIECLLDTSCFEVLTLELPEPLAGTIRSLRDLSTGQSVAYACQIRRR